MEVFNNEQFPINLWVVNFTSVTAQRISLDRNSNLYRKSFEQFICMELRAYLSYRNKKIPLTYWRSKNGHEVDFLPGTKTAIEVKAAKKVGKNDFKGLKYLNEEGVFQTLILVSQDPVGADNPASSGGLALNSGRDPTA